MKKVSGRRYGLGSLEGHVLCLLIYYRTYLTQEFLGFLFHGEPSKPADAQWNKEGMVD